MNRKFVLRNSVKNINSIKENKDIIREVEEARKEIVRAEKYFQCSSDPQLINYSIYWLEAAKCRYMFLLTKAKEKGLKAFL
jgi:Protein of unknown function (DUF2508)